jgi:pimeloyl-ACP methyl ester carboxylesterase
MSAPNPSIAVLCGAGSAGLAWEPAASALGATVLPAPDEDDVATMAGVLAPEVRALPKPRVVVGSSLGAMIALELARTTAVDTLVLVAAGFGVRVAGAVLDRIAADPPGLLARMARGVVADPADTAVVDTVRRDFERRGQPVLLRHMRALAVHVPAPVEAAPPTFVLCGLRDPGVPIADHVELARRCGGAFVPIAQAGHLPYLERPQATVGWIRRVVGWARAW